MNNIYTIQKPNSASKYLGIFGILVSLFLLFFYSNCIEFFIYIGEQYVDLEGKIEANQVISIKVVIATLWSGQVRPSGLVGSSRTCGHQMPLNRCVFLRAAMNP